MYYRIGKDPLEYSVGWYKDIVDRVQKYRRTVVPGDWDGLAKYVDTVAQSAYTGRNLIKFLIDGKDVMAEASRALYSAQKSIHIEVFQLQADNIGQGLADLLGAKSKAGVTVRLMIDEHGSKVDDDPALRKMLDGMRANGIQIIVKKPPFMKKHLDHRKVVVIDGKIGFTGGMNIGSLYQVEWHDQQTLIEGPAVAKLQEAFVERWKTAGGSIGAAEDLFPRIEEYQDGAQTQVIQHIGLRDQNIKAMYLRAIGTAQKSIKIANPYFTDEDVVDALRWAAKRGVKVQLVLPQDNDMALVQHASRHYYPQLVNTRAAWLTRKWRFSTGAWPLSAPPTWTSAASSITTN
jgi:cardiolipin synthase